jgi:hypothetical protein
VRKLAVVAPLAGAARPKNVTRFDLYGRAKRLNIPARSQMNKAELMTAVADRERKVSAA